MRDANRCRIERTDQLPVSSIDDRIRNIERSGQVDTCADHVDDSATVAHQAIAVEPGRGMNELNTVGNLETVGDRNPVDRIRRIAVGGDHDLPPRFPAVTSIGVVANSPIDAEYKHWRAGRSR